MTKEVKAPMVFNKAKLAADIQAGLTRDALAEKYGVSRQAITKIIKAAGLSQKRAASIAFVFEEDMANVPASKGVPIDVPEAPTPNNIEEEATTRNIFS